MLMRVPKFRRFRLLAVAAGLLLTACASDREEAKPSEFEDLWVAWIWMPDPITVAVVPDPEDDVAQAIRYLNGNGVERDTGIAHKLLNKAANEGSGQAAFLLGRLYEEGVGVPKDTEGGLHWIEIAAERQLPAAQYRMGIAYYRGEGRPLNTGHAVRWLKRAAEAGNANAQYQLGIAYHLGRGTLRNEIEAVRWLEAAAEQDHTKAQYLVGDAYSDAWGVEEDLSWAARWYGRAAVQGFARAQYKLGIFYLGGRGLPEDPVIAYKWLALAAEAGGSDALRLLRKLERTMAKEDVARGARLAQVWKPWSAPARRTKKVQIADPASIVFAQYSLTQLGFRPGPIDGKLDALTRQAVAAYQRSSGLTADGRLSLDLLHRLRTDRLARLR